MMMIVMVIMTVTVTRQVVPPSVESLETGVLDMDQWLGEGKTAVVW